jgi:putative ABC transport system ATP-binding protein
MLVIAVSMIPYYLALELPKQIVNGPLQGHGFATAEARQPFMAIRLDLPLLGAIHLSDGIALQRIPLLLALSLTFLALVVVNGLFKLYINTRKGQMGERLLRRIRYELVDRILRFPPARFRKAKAGEISSMVKDEVEPLGGFSGDAFTQPAMLGGQALTALFFIFVQHVWLGLLAAFMAGVQAVIIPRMRRRLILLGRERQLTARELAGRVSEIVDGIQTIHTNNTSNLVRADIASRLGRIFHIRYNIYQWKFLVKFLNNFLAQLTPFFFYSIGGYLTIKGTLDVGQLVAVINAYKELPGPLKELIDWDLARQDVQVKYEQVVEQFDIDDLLDPARQDIDAPRLARYLSPLALQNVALRSDLGSRQLEDISLSFAMGESVAVTGDASSGGGLLCDLLIGAIKPSQGRVMFGDFAREQLSEHMLGHTISYASSTAKLTSGTILDNITYGLKRRPGPLPPESEQRQTERLWRRREARRAGNPDFDFDTDWIEPGAIQPSLASQGLYGAIFHVLDVIGLGDDLISLALRKRSDPLVHDEIAKGVLVMRQDLRARLEADNLANVVLAFDPDAYNAEATIGENLLFGVASEGDASISAILRHPFFAQTLNETGLAAQLFDLGHKFAQQTLEIFASSAQDPNLLQWLPYMTAEQMPEYRLALARTRTGAIAEARIEDRIRLIQLASSYIEPKYRFGLLDDGLRQNLVAARHRLARKVPDELHGHLQLYHPAKYMVAATLLENILFGKINRRIGHAEDRIADTVRAVVRDHFARDPQLRDRIVALGLSHDVGPEGRHLLPLQRQKLVLARALIRNSAYYLFNEPLAGIDPAHQQQLISRILAYLQAQPEAPGLIWVLSNAPLAQQFDRTVEIANGRVVSDSAVPPKHRQKHLPEAPVAQ